MTNLDKLASVNLALGGLVMLAVLCDHADTTDSQVRDLWECWGANHVQHWKNDYGTSKEGDGAPKAAGRLQGPSAASRWRFVLPGLKRGWPPKRPRRPRTTEAPRTEVSMIQIDKERSMRHGA
jgi:hypothetical protein